MIDQYEQTILIKLHEIMVKNSFRKERSGFSSTNRTNTDYVANKTALEIPKSEHV